MSPRRAVLAATAAVAIVFALAAPAGAHVTIPEPVEAGGFGMVNLVVPNERDDASTVALEVRIPREHPLPLVSVEMKPGWESEVTMRTLDEPVELFGNEVTEVVDTIRWTGGTIAPDQFDTFTVRVGPIPDDVDQLLFPAIQTYDSGEEVAWIEEPTEGGEEPERPAPVLTITEAGDETGSGDHGTSGEADETTETDTESGGDAAADQAATPIDEDDGTDPLSVIALIVALVGAAMAAAALLSARRTRS